MGTHRSFSVALPCLVLWVYGCGSGSADETRTSEHRPGSAGETSAPDASAEASATAPPGTASSSSPGAASMAAPEPVSTPTQPDEALFPAGYLLLSPNDVVRSMETLFDADLEFNPNEPDFDIVYGTEWARTRLGGEELTGSIEPRFRGRGAIVDALLDQLTAEQLMAATGCQTPCSLDALDAFVRRAFRRPVELSSWSQQRASFDATLSDEDALRAVVRAIVVDASFQLLSLQGTSDEGIRLLDDFEVASLMAFEITGTLPDEELLQSAEGGHLLVTRGRSGAAQRLWETPAARRYVTSWLLRRLRLEDAQFLEHPLDTAPLEETRRFIEHVVFDESLPLTELLVADYSFLNPELADWYGVTHPGDGFQRLSLSETDRRGILHHASWLSSTGRLTEPDYNGRSVIPLSLLCINLPQEVPFDFDPVPVTEEMTPRERVLAQNMQQPCWNCHHGIDPVGFAFDGFDGQGRERDTYPNGAAVDTTGQIDADWITVDFQDSLELTAELADDPRYRECHIRHWLGNALGFETTDAAIEGAALTTSGDDLRSIVHNRITSDAYIRRAMP